MTNEVIILDMDETRELKWTFGAIKNFEKRAKEILKRMDLKTERGQSITTQPMHAGFILASYLKMSDILEAAVGAATGLSALEGKEKPSETAVAIDGYLQKGGSLEELQRETYKAYLLAADPSSIPAWLENIAKEAEIRRINKEKQEAKMEVARLELAADQEKIEKLKKTSGKQPTESAT